MLRFLFVFISITIADDIFGCYDKKLRQDYDDCLRLSPNEDFSCDFFNITVHNRTFLTPTTNCKKSFYL
eukprot:UN22660